MKKVLIISYFFPPCNFVGAERTAYWTKNLHKYQIYPVVVTRCWNEGQKDIIGKVDNNESKTIKNDEFEVNYVSYNNQLRDYFTKTAFIRKFFTLIYKLSYYIFPKKINYINILKRSDEILKKNPEIKTLIISGRPFESFFFGYKLKKKYSYIQWIPDYRDQWNTYNDNRKKKIINKIFDYFDKRLEKKWTSNSSFFITTTNEWSNRISNLIDKKGKVILNGYSDGLKKISINKASNSLKIVYAGTLYPNQPIEKFISVVSKINTTHSNFIQLQFIGCEMIEGQKERLLNIKKTHKGNFEIIDRIPKAELNDYLSNADFFYLTNFENVKGWYPVKLFEYACYQKPIILYPSDEDIIDNFIKLTNSGFSFFKDNDVESFLIQSIQQTKEKRLPKTKINIKELKKFSRKYQTKKLAELIKEI